MRYVLSTLAISFVLAIPPVTAQAIPGLANRMESAATFYRNRDGFMGMVAVARDHQIVFQHGYGYANLESKISFTLDTQFRIGSLTKQFTAAAILLLQQDGRLKTPAVTPDPTWLPTVPSATAHLRMAQSPSKATLSPASAAQETLTRQHAT